MDETHEGTEGNDSNDDDYRIGKKKKTKIINGIKQL